LAKKLFLTVVFFHLILQSCFFVDFFRLFPQLRRNFLLQIYPFSAFLVYSFGLLTSLVPSGEIFFVTSPGGDFDIEVGSILESSSEEFWKLFILLISVSALLKIQSPN
jgi:hypothetical protein